MFRLLLRGKETERRELTDGKVVCVL